MKKAFETHSPNVRFVYKIIALPMHANAENAARAGFAAMRQGKFWEMHDMLFTHQNALQKSDLEAYAKDLGLDAVKFLNDMNSTAAKDRIERDKKTFELLGAKGTPTVYVNGRDFDPKMDINEWIRLELELGVSGAVAPGGGSMQLAPTASASVLATGAPSLLPTVTASATAKAAPTAAPTVKK
jgi:predicted DsbA family dithiol-disulfide isomerase